MIIVFCKFFVLYEYELNYFMIVVLNCFMFKESKMNK